MKFPLNKEALGAVIFLSIIFSACTPKTPSTPIIQDITLHPVNASVRAIQVIDDQTVWFAGSNSLYGYTEDGGKTWHTNTVPYDTTLHFRAIAVTDNSIFLLTIASPALLFKSDHKGQTWTTVYQEDHPAAFYDAMKFWDNKEGIAMGDPTDGCLSVIITRDGGDHWQKVPCDKLVSAQEGEAAFAASNSNIALYGNHAWIVSGGKSARVFHSSDRGHTWEVFNTPIIQGGTMTGIFSVDFQDDRNGIIIGGDWEKKDKNTQNKAITTDGGKTWQLIADGQEPGYRSCIKYQPDSKGQNIMAVGIPGISWSGNGGHQWHHLSDSAFYTLGFGKTTTWVAGHHKIGKINWKNVE